MSDRPKIFLPEDRYFEPDLRQKEVAMQLYQTVVGAGTAHLPARHDLARRVDANWLAGLWWGAASSTWPMPRR